MAGARLAPTTTTTNHKTLVSTTTTNLMLTLLLLSCQLLTIQAFTTIPFQERSNGILKPPSWEKDMDEGRRNNNHNAPVETTTTTALWSTQRTGGAVQSFVNRASSLMPQQKKKKAVNQKAKSFHSRNIGRSSNANADSQQLRRIVQSQARRLGGTNLGATLDQALRASRSTGGWLTARRAWSYVDAWNEAPSSSSSRDRSGLSRPSDLFSTTSRATHWRVLQYNLHELEFWQDVAVEAHDNQAAAAAQLHDCSAAFRRLQRDGPRGGSYDDIEEWQDDVQEAADRVALAENVAISTQSQLDEAVSRWVKQVTTVREALEERLGPLDYLETDGGLYLPTAVVVDDEDDDDDDFDNYYKPTAQAQRRQRRSNRDDFNDDDDVDDRRVRQKRSPPTRLPTQQARLGNNYNNNYDQDYTKLYDKLQSAFPGAQTNAELVAKTSQLLSKYGYGSNSLLAFSLCCDEVNRPLEDDFETVYGSAFNMGGLAGFPFGGVTSFGAMAKHIPDGGSCLLVYGPHVGVNGDGKVGTVDRRGKKEGGACCGSAVAASGAVTAPPAPKGTSLFSLTKPTPAIATEDAQQTFVTNMLRPYAPNLKKADDSMVELPYSLFDAVDELTNKILSKASSYVGAPGTIALLGGIQINTPDGVSDYFLPLRFEVRDNANNLVEDLLFVNRFNDRRSFDDSDW